MKAPAAENTAGPPPPASPATKTENNPEIGQRCASLVSWQLGARTATTAGTLTVTEMLDYFRGNDPPEGLPNDLAALIAEIRRLGCAEVDEDLEPEERKVAGEEKTHLKSSLPAFTLSGEVLPDKNSRTTRAGAEQEGRFRHAGILQIDIDGKDNPDTPLQELRNVAESCPWAFAVFTSPSGRGVKALAAIPTDIARHKDAAIRAERWFAERGVKIDPAPKNPVSLCFASHDPNLTIKNDAKVMDPPKHPPMQTGRGRGRPREATDTTKTGLSMFPKKFADRLVDVARKAENTHTDWIFGVVRMLAKRDQTLPSDKVIEVFEDIATIAPPPTRDGFGDTEREEALRSWQGHIEELKAKAAEQAEFVDEGDWIESWGYDGRRYWKATGEKFVPLGRESARRHLVAIAPPTDKGTPDYEAAGAMLTRIENERFLAHVATGWAGWTRGFHRADMGDQTPDLVLLRSGGDSPPEAGDGDPGPWLEMIRRMTTDDSLSDPGMQTSLLLGWLATFRRATLEPGPDAPKGNALVMSGPAQSGKTVFFGLIRNLLGIRGASAGDFLTGATRFNGDIVGAEMLVIDDDEEGGDNETRRRIGAHIKGVLYGHTPRAELKGQDAVRPPWLVQRVCIACNDGPDALRILPDLNARGMEDKFLVMQVRRGPPDWPYDSDGREFREWKRKLAESAPAFLRFLDEYEIPTEIADGRSGVIGWRHPELQDPAGAPEDELLELIDMAVQQSREIGMFDRHRDAQKFPLEKSGAELRALVTADWFNERITGRILTCKYPAQIGRLLKKLEQKSDRVKQIGQTRNNSKIWRIESPPK